MLASSISIRVYNMKLSVWIISADYEFHYLEPAYNGEYFSW